MKSKRSSLTSSQQKLLERFRVILANADRETLDCIERKLTALKCGLNRDNAARGEQRATPKLISSE